LICLFQDENKPYNIFVKTSSKFGSGTDSKVFIKLIGEEMSTEKIQLSKSLTHKDPFESGNEDRFEVLTPYRLGMLSKIK
jgi:hypothetical protein